LEKQRIVFMEYRNWSELILIVEDDRKVAALVSNHFEEEGFKTIIAYDGKQALESLKRHSPTFVILDLMLSKEGGCEVCRELRGSTTIPILILTATQEELERISGLSLGVDDYMVKPFSPQKLVERIKAIFRRLNQYPLTEKSILRCGELVLDPGRRRITLKGHSVSVTPSEFRLLHALMAAPGRVFSRQELLDQLYPMGDNVVDRVIDVHIGNLRKKIEVDPSNPRYILTAWGVGYQLKESTA
jgi:DNA-binding response OmpR family regulator